MSPPLRPDQFLSVLRAEGLRVVEVGAWRTHNRAGHGAWGPINGVMIHHTVTTGTAHTVDQCRDGYPSLPGPLCHGVIAKDGTVYLVGYGRANHAGGGDPAVLQHVIAEDYGTRTLHPTRGNSDGVDGNHAFYGFECENLGDGRDPWPSAQLTAIEQVAAALCRAHDWSALSAIGHREWSSDKIDPRGAAFADLGAWRKRVATRIAHRPTAATVSLAAVVYGATHTAADERRHPSYRDDVQRVQDALVANGRMKTGTFVHGIFDPVTRAAYAAEQRAQGYHGADADGIPGRASLTNLGADRYTVTD